VQVAGRLVFATPASSKLGTDVHLTERYERMVVIGKNIQSILHYESIRRTIRYMGIFSKVPKVPLSADPPLVPNALKCEHLLICIQRWS
jgi:CBS domain containing-hemolysin-like protein